MGDDKWVDEVCILITMIATTHSIVTRNTSNRVDPELIIGSLLLVLRSFGIVMFRDQTLGNVVVIKRWSTRTSSEWRYRPDFFFESPMDLSEQKIHS